MEKAVDWLIRAAVVAAAVCIGLSGVWLVWLAIAWGWA